MLLSNLNPSYAKKHPAGGLQFDDKSGERFDVTVITEGHHGTDVSVTGQLGRTLAVPAEGPGVSIPRGVDVDSFWNIVIDCIQRADDCNAARHS